MNLEDVEEGKKYMYRSWYGNEEVEVAEIAKRYVLIIRDGDPKKSIWVLARHLSPK
jgi:hypothetical protein